MSALDIARQSVAMAVNALNDATTTIASQRQDKADLITLVDWCVDQDYTPDEIRDRVEKPWKFADELGRAQRAYGAASPATIADLEEHHVIEKPWQVMGEHIADTEDAATERCS